MNWNLLSNLFIGLFLLAPGAILIIRFLKGRRFPWWIAIVLSLVAGWGCVVGAALSAKEDQTAQMQAYEARGEDVPDDLMEAWANDASSVFAVMFGWAFALPILCAWLIAYAIAHGIRSTTRKRESAQLPSPS
jgi:hypothetical protein